MDINSFLSVHFIVEIKRTANGKPSNILLSSLMLWTNFDSEKILIKRNWMIDIFVFFFAEENDEWKNPHTSKIYWNNLNGKRFLIDTNSG